MSFAANSLILGLKTVTDSEFIFKFLCLSIIVGAINLLTELTQREGL